MDEQETQETPAAAPDAGARLEEIFRAFEAKGAAGAKAATQYAFELQGSGGGRHVLRLSPDGVQWEKDSTTDADVTVKLSVDDFLAIADGSFDGRLALASERIEISGDLVAAESLL